MDAQASFARAQNLLSLICEQMMCCEVPCYRSAGCPAVMSVPHWWDDSVLQPVINVSGLSLIGMICTTTA